MRVLEVITGGEPGGAQRHVAELTQGLRAAGHDVQVVHGGGRWLESAVGPTHYLPALTRRVTGGGDVAAVRALVEVMRAWRPSVVHAHSSKAGLLARVAARRVGVPAVYTAHGFVFTDPTRPAWERRLYRELERWAGRRSAAVIAVSGSDAAWAAAAGVRRVAHIPNGVALPAASWQPPPGPPWRVGFLGRFGPEKGLAVLIQAIASAGAGWQLVVGGDGPGANEYRQAAAAQGVDAEFLGWQSHPAEFFAPLHALAIPSWKEGLPYTLLDALAYGLPTIVTDVGAMGDVVRPLDPHLVVPAGDPQSLTMAIRGAAEGRGGSFAARARAHVVRHFDLAQMVTRTAQVLEEASHEQRSEGRDADGRRSH